MPGLWHSPNVEFSLDAGINEMTQDKTLNSYNLTAEAYAQNVGSLHPVEAGKQFVQMLPSNGLVLDLGCGPGRDAKVFTEQGLRVMGIDFSTEMIALARQSAPIAHFEVMEMETLTFLSGMFDGVWASASLLHMPKNKFSLVLAQIHRVLKHRGIFYLSLKEGKGEGLEPDTRYGGLEKFWSYFECEELTHLLQ